jgi:hypothetical protein
MAKVKFPAASLEAHGTIGGLLTFQRRGRGFAVIAPPRPPRSVSMNPTLAQTEQRLKIKSLVLTWQEMTPEQKEIWNAKAKLAGDTLAGYHVYIREASAEPIAIVWVLGPYTGSDPRRRSFEFNFGTLT